MIDSGGEKNKKRKLEIVTNELKEAEKQIEENMEVIDEEEEKGEEEDEVEEEFEGTDLIEDSGRVVEFNTKNLKPGVDLMAALRSATKGVIANATIDIPPRSPSPSNESPGDSKHVCLYLFHLIIFVFF